MNRKSIIAILILFVILTFDLFTMYDISDYYVIGDLHSAALISKDASIDWLCLPHFDSPSIFAKLLDRKGGSFSLATNTYTITSNYLKGTAVVEFTCKSTESAFVMHDFMVPMPEAVCENHFLVRKFIGVKGKSKITLFFNPKLEYATKKSQLVFDEKSFSIKLRMGKDILLLYLPKNAHVYKKQEGYDITFELSEKEEKDIVLEYIMEGCLPLYNNQDTEKQTVKFWHEWVAKGNFFDFCRDNLIRSAITLKLMQFYPTGAIVASPTTSLPESIGGERNWDYRYVWIRDATFTLYALYVLGFIDEAKAFFNFIQSILEKCSKEAFDISLIYTISGEKVPEEKFLPNLSGYKYSQPIRIGNGARDQFQLDVYGALIDAYYFISKRGYAIDATHKEIIINLAQKIKESWQKEDNGIWEVRSGSKHFTYSKVMAWVGINRLLRMTDKLQLSLKQQREYKTLEKEIFDWIWQNCFDTKNKTFRQYPNATYQDATNFLFVLLQFLDKHDPLTKTIIKQTSKELCFNEVFVYRYFSDDGIKGTEGAFLLCSFWLISALAIIEDIDKAYNLFSKLETYMANSGLLSEEINPDTGEYLGNFPQAFSHIGFIMSAYYLNRYRLKRKNLAFKNE